MVLIIIIYCICMCRVHCISIDQTNIRSTIEKFIIRTKRTHKKNAKWLLFDARFLIRCMMLKICSVVRKNGSPCRFLFSNDLIPLCVCVEWIERFYFNMSSWKWKEPESSGMLTNTIGILIAERWMTNVPNQFL